MCNIKTLQLCGADFLLPASSGNNPILNSRYRILHLLGEGGFGRTFLCLDEILGTYAAIKEISGQDASSRLLSLKEARVLAAFRRLPGIVTAIDFFSDADKSYIVMDYIEGENLSVYCKNNSLSLLQLLNILEDVFLALSYMHSIGMVHRDISPGNIIISDGKAKLLDFGSTCRTGENTPIVTPGYSPREQYMGNVGTWSDVYAMSATICSAYLKVRLPESIERTEDKIFYRSIVKQVKKYNGLNKNVDSYLEVLERALCIDYKNRYADMTEFYNALTLCTCNSSSKMSNLKLLLAFAALITNCCAYEHINRAYGISLWKENSESLFRIIEGMFNV